LLLLPQGRTKPFSASPEYKEVGKILGEVGGVDLVHVCGYTPPFGVIPLEIDDVFPLSQFEAAYPFSGELKADAARKITAYLKVQRYEVALVHPDPEFLDLKALRGGGTRVRITTRRREPWSDKALQELKETLDRVLKPLKREEGKS
jgi:predicted RNA-binding protein